MAHDIDFEARGREHQKRRGGRMAGTRLRADNLDRVQTSIWLTEDLREKLRLMCKSDGVPMAEAVEKMVRREWERREKKMHTSIGIKEDISPAA